MISPRLLQLAFCALPGSRARGLRKEYRDLARLSEADVAFVSFPKSGRTFVRAMLARLYQDEFGIDERELLEFSALRSAPRSPLILFTHDQDAMRRPSEIRIRESAYEGRKVVLLARHPGDIVISRYHHLKHRSRDPARRRLAARPIEQFVWTEHGGIPSVVTYLNGWAGLARKRGDMLIVRYEDFVGEPEAALRRLANFVGLRTTLEEIEDAAESARFERLKAKEREGYFSSERLRVRSADGRTSAKVREGGSGGFRKALDAATAARIQAYVERHLDPVFGYRLEPIRSSGEGRSAEALESGGSGGRRRPAHPTAKAGAASGSPESAR